MRSSGGACLWRCCCRCCLPAAETPQNAPPRRGACGADAKSGASAGRHRSCGYVPCFAFLRVVAQDAYVYTCICCISYIIGPRESYQDAHIPHRYVAPAHTCITARFEVAMVVMKPGPANSPPSFSGSIIGMSLKVSKELQCDCCGFCQYTILTYQACPYCCMFTSCRRQTKKIERGGAQSYAKCCAHPRGTVAPFWCTLLDGKMI